MFNKIPEWAIYVQVMPLSGFFVSKLLKLPSHYAAGLILVACCPGGVYALPFPFFSLYRLATGTWTEKENVSAGTASNIVTYLAR
jgi:predicted Na+-dependent transporter